MHFGVDLFLVNRLFMFEARSCLFQSLVKLGSHLKCFDFYSVAIPFVCSYKICKLLLVNLTCLNTGHAVFCIEDLAGS